MADKALSTVVVGGGASPSVSSPAKPTKLAKSEKADLRELVPVSRATALAGAVRAKMKDQESIQIYGKGDELPVIEAISTGSLGLDRATGIGGLPRGRIIEIFGPESSGKTTLAIQAMAAAQAAGGVASIVDAEHALDLNYAKSLGVNSETLLIAQPSCGEEGLDIAEVLVTQGKPGDIVVVDSVAALVPRAEIEGAMGDSHMGLHARLMGQALRKITALAHSNGVLVIFINQLRQKIGVVYGNPEVTTGGNALKFYASMRIDIRRIAQNKEGDVVISHKTRAKIVKNKVAPPFREAEFDIRFGTGVDYRAEMLDLGQELDRPDGKGKIIERSGTWYAHYDERIANGREASIQALVAKPEWDQKIYQEIRQAMLPKKA